MWQFLYITHCMNLKHPSEQMRYDKVFFNVPFKFLGNPEFVYKFFLKLFEPWRSSCLHGTRTLKVHWLQSALMLMVLAVNHRCCILTGGGQNANSSHASLKCELNECLVSNLSHTLKRAKMDPIWLLESTAHIWSYYSHTLGLTCPLTTNRQDFLFPTATTSSTKWFRNHRNS